MGNKLIVASAGAGKTTFIVNEALKNPKEKCLITTFTQANEREIRDKIISVNGTIPSNVTVKTWFSFLIQHGAKPYQGGVYEKRIKGLILFNGRSGIKYCNGRWPVYYSEGKEFEQHYFSKDGKIYSDKLAKFVIRCNKQHKGLVLQRLSRCFDHIFIDEVQDLSGYDLEILKELFASGCNTLLVGDPRQGTYSTSNAAKNKKFSKSKIMLFFESVPEGLEIDDKTFTVNHRCVQEICRISNKLFPDLPPSESGNNVTTGHDGVILVKPCDVDRYLERFSPLQLRDRVTKKVNLNYRVLNFGISKGLTFERVLIYPTKPMFKWIKDNTANLELTSRSNFYVALTRAEQSVAIVCEYNDELAKSYRYFE